MGAIETFRRYMADTNAIGMDDFSVTTMFAGKLDAELTALTAERDALAKFKAYVHQRLDEEEVPGEFPDGKHSEAGCRIGDRLDWVFSMLSGERSNVSNYKEAWLSLRAKVADWKTKWIVGSENYRHFEWHLEFMDSLIAPADAAVEDKTKCSMEPSDVRHAFEQLYECWNYGELDDAEFMAKFADLAKEQR